jgi:hypothetical protein
MAKIQYGYSINMIRIPKYLTSPHIQPKIINLLIFKELTI